MQGADPGTRRRAILLVVVVAIVGAALLGYFTWARPAIEDWAAHDPRSRVRAMLILLGLITVLPLLGVALALWRLGGRILAAGRFPLPGQRTTRATPVLTGNAALRRGRLAQAFGGVIAVLAIAFTFLLWQLATAW